jgi:hypothetical protein
MTSSRTLLDISHSSERWPLQRRERPLPA